MILLSIDSLLQAWDAMWRVSLPVVEARVRGWDHTPKFYLSNNSIVLAGVEHDAPRHLWEDYQAPPIAFHNFLEGVTSPEHSRLGADGNEEVLNPENLTTKP